MEATIGFILVIVVFIALYMDKRHDCKMLEKDIKELKKQLSATPGPVALDVDDLRPLDKDSAMEAIRHNGYVPDFDGDWISFMVQGERYTINPDRFPVMTIMKHYNLVKESWNMDLMHRAAHQVSDEIIIAKVLFIGEDEDGIAFQVTAIEDKYGHFRDCLTRYISIIEDAHARMVGLYNKMEKAQKEQLTTYHLLQESSAEENSIAS